LTNVTLSRAAHHLAAREDEANYEIAVEIILRRR